MQAFQGEEKEEKYNLKKMKSKLHLMKLIYREDSRDVIQY